MAFAIFCYRAVKCLAQFVIIDSVRDCAAAQQNVRNRIDGPDT